MQKKQGYNERRNNHGRCTNFLTTKLATEVGCPRFVAYILHKTVTETLRSQALQLIYWFELPDFRISFPNPGVTLSIQQTKEEGTLMKILTTRPGGEGGVD